MKRILKFFKYIYNKIVSLFKIEDEITEEEYNHIINKLKKYEEILHKEVKTKVDELNKDIK